MKRLLLAAAVTAAPCRAVASPPEGQLGLENFLYPTAQTALNRGNILELRDPEGLLRLAAGVKQSWGGARFVARGYAEKRWEGVTTFRLRQAYAQYWWGSVVGLRAGKQRIAWGSGFAWNPTSRIEPPRNPFNTGLEQEGIWALRADVVPSAKTGLILVAARSRNEPGDLPFDTGRLERRAFGGRVRYLAGASDLALVVSGGRNLRTLVGLDVTRGWGGSWAAHAEASVYRGAELASARDGRTFFRLATGVLRTTGDTALAIEYFFNGEGYSDRAFEAYLRRLERGYAASVDPALPPPVREQARLAYLSAAGLPFSGGLGLRRHYLQASWTRANIASRWTAAMRGAIGLDDGGLALTPGVSFAPGADVTIGLDAIVLLGPAESEFRLAPVRGGMQSRVTWSF